MNVDMKADMKANMKVLQRGYTLIELMVVVAIIGIISAIALPSYQSYTCDTYRGQAVAQLRVCALALDRFYSDGFTYVGAVINGTGSSVCTNRSPVEGAAKFDITLVSATVSDYTVRAAKATGETCGNTMELTADGTLSEP